MRCAAGDSRVELAEVCLKQTWMAGAPLVVIVAAVYRRTTAEYGDRGIRFVFMEVGSVYQNIHLQAAALGLGTTVVGAFDAERAIRLLELPVDHEPLAMMPVGMVG
jgi:SagB-type dehydrogenase family enzyme